VYQLDTVATAAVVAGGYDRLAGEPIPVANGTQGGAPSRREKAAVEVPCQIDRQNWGDDQLVPGGHDPVTTILLTCHFADLERLGLVHGVGSPAEGQPMLGPGDRIAALKRLDGAIVIRFPDPPGLFVVGAEHAGWGLHVAAPQRNLLILTCQPARRSR
jgi:hypothetical protein